MKLMSLTTPKSEILAAIMAELQQRLSDDFKIALCGPTRSIDSIIAIGNRLESSSLITSGVTIQIDGSDLEVIFDRQGFADAEMGHRSSLPLGDPHCFDHLVKWIEDWLA
jgi:hypothetical protein